MKTALRWLRRLAIATMVLVGLFSVMQLIPYGHAHDNPPVVSEPAWDHPRTRELAKRACFDCHSNETSWPWYANVAPMSWVVASDVEAGRSVLNFSEWTNAPDIVSATSASVLGGEMPPRGYALQHGDARLTTEERVALARGLHATFGLEWRE
jgi:hypothetical protein